MDEQSLRRLMMDVALTQEEELDDEAVAAHMEEAAETGERSAELDAHLRRWAPSREVFDALQAITAMEAADALPSLEALWDELRPLTRDGGATTAAPVAPATAPRVPESPGPEGWWTRLSHSLFGPAPSFAPAALAVAVLFAGIGWWQALQTREAVTALSTQVTDLQKTAAEYDDMIEMVRRVNRSNFAQAADGSWARIIYHDDLDRGMVYAGSLPEATEGQQFACWLIDDEGNAMLAWEGSEEDLQASPDGQVWWPVEMDQPFGDYHAMILTLEPSHEVVVEIPFSEQNG